MIATLHHVARIAGMPAAMCFAALAQGPLSAQAAPGSADLEAADRAFVHGSTGQNFDGVISINIASGNHNQQLRSLVIVSGAGTLASGSAAQSITSVGRSDPSALVAVGQGVFNGANGVMSLNVAAGDANQQANLGLFAIGINGLVATDALLSQTRASGSQEQSAPQGSSSNTAVLPSDVLGGAQGLVQFNLTAGNRNSSANIFALSAAGGGS